MESNDIAIVLKAMLEGGDGVPFFEIVIVCVFLAVLSFKNIVMPVKNFFSSFLTKEVFEKDIESVKDLHSEMKKNEDTNFSNISDKLNTILDLLNTTNANYSEINKTLFQINEYVKMIKDDLENRK